MAKLKKIYTMDKYLISKKSTTGKSNREEIRIFEDSDTIFETIGSRRVSYIGDV